MKRLLVDLNVILDVALERSAFATPATALWAAIEERRIRGVLSAHAFPTLFYIVRKHHGSGRARALVADLAATFDVAPNDGAVVARALSLGLGDFEDAVTAAAAEAAGCDAVVTRDARGFEGAPVRATSPAAVLTEIGDEVHEPRAAYDRPVIRRRRRASG